LIIGPKLYKIKFSRISEGGDDTLALDLRGTFVFGPTSSENSCQTDLVDADDGGYQPLSIGADSACDQDSRSRVAVLLGVLRENRIPKAAIRKVRYVHFYIFIIY
jgi:hypothetical protein